MPLVEIALPEGETTIPYGVRAFLREAGRRIEQFQSTSRIPAFVPSDFAGAYVLLKALDEGHCAPGSRFCEWGSGFGVVTALAAMLNFDACGIEVEPELVAAARQLADDFDVPVRFAQDSFIPAGGEAFADVAGSFSWMTTLAGEAEEELSLAVDDFDVIFAYPWPDEEWVIDNLFRRFGAVGAVLVTYHGGEGFRLQRKTGRGRGRD